MIYSSVNNGDVKKSNINNNLNSDRIFLFDNIKFFLMLLCVIGHFALYDKTHFAFIRSLFLFIHTFHMQLFIFISGLFYSKLKVKYNVLFYLCIFILMKFILDILNSVLFNVSNFAIFDTNNIYWFMLVLVNCNLITFFIDKCDLKLMIVLSIIVALIAGFDKNATHQFAIQRTCVFYPFFLIGVNFEKKVLINLLDFKYLKIIGLFIIIIYLIILILGVDKGLYDLIDFFGGWKPYSMTKFPQYAMLIRALSYCLTLLVGFSFILVIPNCYIPYITDFGQKTLQVYFYHFYIRTIVRGYGVLSVNSISNFIILLFISIVITVVLSLKPFDFPFDFLKKAIKNNRN